MGPRQQGNVFIIGFRWKVPNKVPQFGNRYQAQYNSYVDVLHAQSSHGHWWFGSPTRTYSEWYVWSVSLVISVRLVDVYNKMITCHWRTHLYTKLDVIHDETQLSIIIKCKIMLSLSFNRTNHKWTSKFIYLLFDKQKNSLKTYQPWKLFICCSQWSFSVDTVRHMTLKPHSETMKSFQTFWEWHQHRCWRWVLMKHFSAGSSNELSVGSVGFLSKWRFC